MPCNHCGALRDLKGGVMLGGEVSAELVPGCPCPVYPRWQYGGPHVIDLEVSDLYFSNAEKLFEFKMCTHETALLWPRILSVECLNYDLGDTLTDILIQTFPGIPEPCSYYMGGGTMAYYYWFNHTTPYGAGEIMTITPGSFVAIWVWIYIQLPAPPIDPPILRITYQID